MISAARRVLMRGVMTGVAIAAHLSNAHITEQDAMALGRLAAPPR